MQFKLKVSDNAQWNFVNEVTVFAKKLSLFERSKIGNKDFVELVFLKLYFLNVFFLINWGDHVFNCEGTGLKINVVTNHDWERIVQIVFKTKTVVDKQEFVGPCAIAIPRLPIFNHGLATLIDENNVSLLNHFKCFLSLLFNVTTC